mmetsp:Transcript_233/g.350  ORF Transcript_233/g.350 Transcript_233/m.350 type:complete len:424 (-) Transcript_233:46-1317(-)|eukprot:CAMPEP_0195296354 /NCGR_PEP_ID=MMETSP0707-20130614/19255_1 /TAXON_ID=33640 /ORGANISM="Asterionellopsis glacialis, Strain CCMP134" /LENGTH=423 /DNA_ID=CAMNT_0040357835 /DNA_START=13 /DNA_END=1284 /DNA_ORIENTATION=+
MTTKNKTKGSEKSTEGDAPHEENDETDEAANSRSNSQEARNNLNEKDEEHQELPAEEEDVKLYKSSRLKGYMTLLLASSLNYIAAIQSNKVILQNAVSSTRRQIRYAQAVGMGSGLVNLLAVLAHCDRITPLKSVWIKAFRPKSMFEFAFIVYLLLWWIIAAWVQTGVRGICGDGKGQFNLYFSTWACCATSVWILERWLVAYGLSSMKAFLASWPNRAPGWIAIFFLSLSVLLSVVDIFLNWDDASNDIDVEPNPIAALFEGIPESQWQWYLFLAAVTTPVAAGFVVVELFRENKTNEEQDSKKKWENILEGAILAIFVLAWIPTVIVVTTPGGLASGVGNTYFFTWAATAFIMETFVWWIHDWRKSIHAMLRKQEEEYRKIQEEVLTKALAEEQGTEKQSRTQITSENSSARSHSIMAGSY